MQAEIGETESVRGLLGDFENQAGRFDLRTRREHACNIELVEGAIFGEVLRGAGVDERDPAEVVTGEGFAKGGVSDGS